MVWMSGIPPISIQAPAMLTCHLDAPTCPLSSPAVSGNPANPVSVSLACRWPLDLGVEQGQRRRNVVGVCWNELVQAGQRVGETEGGSQSTLLAFTGSARIPKFFSNLQLLDVEANHQRGSPRAFLPYPPHPPPPIHAPALPIFSPSRVPSHSSLFTYSCVYLLFHRLCLS